MKVLSQDVPSPSDTYKKRTKNVVVLLFVTMKRMLEFADFSARFNDHIIRFQFNDHIIRLLTQRRVNL